MKFILASLLTFLSLSTFAAESYECALGKYPSTDIPSFVITLDGPEVIASFQDGSVYSASINTSTPVTETGRRIRLKAENENSVISWYTGRPDYMGIGIYLKNGSQVMMSCYLINW